MITVYKYQIALGLNHVPMPFDARILHFAAQNGALWIWAKVSTTAPVVTRSVRVLGTGHDLGIGSEYIGTVQAGAYVWHAFDLGEEES